MQLRPTDTERALQEEVRAFLARDRLMPRDLPHELDDRMEVLRGWQAACYRRPRRRPRRSRADRRRGEGVRLAVRTVGIVVTEEHPAHRVLRRILVHEHRFGDATHHERELGWALAARAGARREATHDGAPVPLSVD